MGLLNKKTPAAVEEMMKALSSDENDDQQSAIKATN
jgi:hypothetical protein